MHGRYFAMLGSGNDGMIDFNEGFVERPDLSSRTGVVIRFVGLAMCLSIQRGVCMLYCMMSRKALKRWGLQALSTTGTAMNHGGLAEQ